MGGSCDRSKREIWHSREIVLVFRDGSLFVVRGVDCIRQGETEDRRIKCINPQFTTNISELGKDTKNKKRCLLDNDDSGNGCWIFLSFYVLSAVYAWSHLIFTPWSLPMRIYRFRIPNPHQLELMSELGVQSRSVWV